MVGIGRRASAPSAHVRHLELDLTDPGACARAAHELPAADVVFFAAYAPRPSPAEEVAPNLAMLSNLVEAVEPRSPALRRAVLLQGSKWYGSHLGPYKTPADEDDPLTDKEPLWRDMVRRYGLRPHGLAEIAGWRFGDFVFHSGNDHISNLTRARQAGWCESLDTGEVLVELLRDLRAQRIIP